MLYRVCSRATEVGDFDQIDGSRIATPALCIDEEIFESNIDAVLKIARDPERLWPHIKTYKCGRIVSRLQSRGIRSFKCATIAEADLLGRCGVRNAMLAYPVTGPSIGLLLDLGARYRRTSYSCLIQDDVRLDSVAKQAAERGQILGTFIDIDSGQGRTGIDDENRIVELAERATGLNGIEFRGFHLYDGQNHQHQPEMRRDAIRKIWDWRSKIVSQLKQRGISCPITVAGGTPTFPFWAEIDECSLSPGTAFIHDSGYSAKFPDLPFRPAAFVLGRIVSRRSDGAITIDVGSKAIATDPVGARGWFPDLDDPELLEQSEEHWIIRESEARERRIGDLVRVVPTHICPTINLFHEIVVKRSESRKYESWSVDARDRKVRIN